jgi:hypothetical protein
MEPGRHGHDDEVHDRIRGEHTGGDVRATGVEFLARRATTLRQIAADRVLFFDFLRRLPEDKYGESVVSGIATRMEKRRATMPCAE